MMLTFVRMLKNVKEQNRCKKNSPSSRIWTVECPSQFQATQ